MKTLALVVALALAACGGKKAAPSNQATPATPDNKPVAASTCCCELPSDPPTFQTHDRTQCHEDHHGVCKDDAAAKCTK